ncbi:hypothetical protein FKP32DRAFT_1586977 [Trametes sanguinea]|nr:hypothetical protein FKP32DRAFT_1586977 [Trametes sanguinea]
MIRTWRWALCILAAVRGAPSAKSQLLPPFRPVRGQVSKSISRLTCIYEPSALLAGGTPAMAEVQALHPLRPGELWFPR